jgi:hypothetical protein
LRPPAFRCVTGHIGKGTLLLASRARFGVFFTDILLDKVATATALPPDLFIHGSLLSSIISLPLRVSGDHLLVKGVYHGPLYQSIEL